MYRIRVFFYVYFNIRFPIFGWKEDDFSVSQVRKLQQLVKTICIRPNAYKVITIVNFIVRGSMHW